MVDSDILYSLPSFTNPERALNNNQSKGTRIAVTATLLYSSYHSKFWKWLEEEVLLILVRMILNMQIHESSNVRDTIQETRFPAFGTKNSLEPHFIPFKKRNYYSFVCVCFTWCFCLCQKCAGSNGSISSVRAAVSTCQSFTTPNDEIHAAKQWSQNRV